jgi:hypothetical protein
VLVDGTTLAAERLWIGAGVADRGAPGAEVAEPPRRKRTTAKATPASATIACLELEPRRRMDPDMNGRGSPV